MQRAVRLPRLEPDAGDELAGHAGRRSGTATPLQASANRSGSQPVTRACSRSTELST